MGGSDASECAKNARSALSSSSITKAVCAKHQALSRAAFAPCRSFLVLQVFRQMGDKKGMGHISHTAIVITGNNLGFVAQEIRRLELGEVSSAEIHSGFNDISSIFVGPRGSKQFWPDDKAHRAKLNELREFLSRYDHLSWVQIEYGLEGLEIPRIVDSDMGDDPRPALDIYEARRIRDSRTDTKGQ